MWNTYSTKTLQFTLKVYFNIERYKILKVDLQSFIREAVEYYVLNGFLVIDVREVDPAAPFLLPDLKGKRIAWIKVKLWRV